MDPTIRAGNRASPFDTARYRQQGVFMKGLHSTDPSPAQLGAQRSQTGGTAKAHRSQDIGTCVKVQQ